MELSQIRYFLDAAQSQHITKSAERLHIAQPALTKAIHRLEEELEVPLFIRRGRGIILSEYGRYLQKKLSPIVARLDRLPDELHSMAKLENHTVHLNVLAASSLVTEAVIEYKKTHAAVNFELMQNTESELYDIGVTTQSIDEARDVDSSVDVPAGEAVMIERIYLAVPLSHRLALSDRVKLIEAQGEGFISLMGSRQFRTICDGLCADAGFAPNIIFESDNPATVKNMIAAGMGVGFWPEFTWGELDSDGVRLIEIVEPVCVREIQFHYRKNKLDHSTVEDFFEFLTSFCLGKMPQA